MCKIKMLQAEATMKNPERKGFLHESSKQSCWLHDSKLEIKCSASIFYRLPPIIFKSRSFTCKLETRCSTAKRYRSLSVIRIMWLCAHIGDKISSCTYYLWIAFCRAIFNLIYMDWNSRYRKLKSLKF